MDVKKAEEEGETEKMRGEEAALEKAKNEKGYKAIEQAETRWPKR
jgi:hypothetical protein